MKRKKIPLWGIIAICIALMQMAARGALAQPLDFSVIAGQWTRIDGNYSLRVQDVMPDGKVNASYFNPGRIHVVDRYDPARAVVVPKRSLLHDHM